MEMLGSNRVLAIALTLSVVIHIAIAVGTTVEFGDIPQQDRTLNLRLVKPLIPLPSTDDVEVEEGVPTDSDTNDETLIPGIVDFESETSDELTVPQEEPQQVFAPSNEVLGPDPAIPPGLEPISEPNVVERLSNEELVQSVAEFAAASTEEEETEKQIRRISDEGTSSIEETFYLRSWLRKVRRIGQLNYPREAAEQKLYGTLSLYVSIAPDGSLVETRVLESSGHEILDKAAENIVKLAAPFAPFPASMRQDTDLLEIVRDWEFRKSSYTTDPPDEDDE